MRVFYAMSGDTTSPPLGVPAVSDRLKTTAIFQASAHGTPDVIYKTFPPKSRSPTILLTWVRPATNGDSTTIPFAYTPQRLESTVPLLYPQLLCVLVCVQMPDQDDVG